jgi:hypothetical protein
MGLGSKKFLNFSKRSSRAGAASQGGIEAALNAHFGMMRFLYMIRVTLSTKIL